MFSLVKAFHNFTMKSIVVAIIFSSFLFSTVLGGRGFDGIQAVSKATFECLAKDGYHFFIARVWESVGNYDNQGITNIKNARAAGWKEVDGYLFPCLRSSCAAAKNQVEATINKLAADKAEIGTLWLDVEILNWPADHAHNQKFITDMVAEAERMKKKVGIYSSYNNWQSIVGAGWAGVKHLPLWWATYNGHENFDNFKAFGGWTKPTIHQYSGSVKGPCGVNMDQNWKP